MFQIFIHVWLHLLQTSSSSFRRPHEASKPTSHVQNKEHSNLLYQSDHSSSPGLIVRRSLHDPLSGATIRSITSSIANTSNLNLPHTISQVGRANFPGSQNAELNSGTCTTLILGSTPLRHISFFQSLFGLPNNLLRSLWPSIWPPHVSADSTFRFGQASAFSSDDNGVQNVTQIDLWRQLLMESTLYMHTPADSLLEGSTSFFVVTANRGVNFRLVTEVCLLFHSILGNLFSTTTNVKVQHGKPCFLYCVHLLILSLKIDIYV